MSKAEDNASTEDTLSIDGKYESNEGDLEIQSSNGKVEFNLLVVSNDGRTGDVEGHIALDGSYAVYKAEDCQLQFKFSKNSVNIVQEGTCEMGLNASPYTQLLDFM